MPDFTTLRGACHSESGQQIPDLLAIAQLGPADFGETEAGMEGVRGRVGRVAVDLADDLASTGIAGGLEQIPVQHPREPAAPGRCGDGRKVTSGRI